MKYVLTNYNNTPDWIHEYTDDYLIYDRSDSKEYLKDFDQSKIIYVENVGDADYDRLGYIVDNYFDLPEVFLLSKSNLFKFISKEEFDKVKDNTTFTPLLTQNHKVYEPVCRYQDGMYMEINNSWYMLGLDWHYFQNYTEFAKAFNLPNPDYLTFAPGGNYILTRENVYKYGLAFYEGLRSILPYCQRPGEAHCIERSLYTIWS